MQFLVEKKSGPGSCEKCRKEIKKGALVTNFSILAGVRSVFHLRCLQPPICSPIFFEQQVRFSASLSDSEVTRAQEWFVTWNNQFVRNESQIPVQFLTRCATFPSFKYRRLLLESFRYLTPKEVTNISALVCKEWYQVARDEELWGDFFTLEYSDQTVTDKHISNRTKYIIYALGACWYCKRLVDLRDIKLKCKLFKKPLCYACANNPYCSTVCLRQYLRIRLIQPSTGKMLHFPYFYNPLAWKTSYLTVLADRMVPYAKKRVDLLLRTMSDSGEPQELIDAVDIFQAEKFYLEGFFNVTTLVQKVVGKFCGMNERRENFTASYTACVQGLKKIARPTRPPSSPQSR